MDARPVEKLHAAVDKAVRRLEVLHGEALVCRRGCHDCCVDDLTVFEVEAERIRARHGELLAQEEPHPPGKCAFLDAEGACRVYPSRPYVCRTQGLPLRWLDEDDGGAPVEYRDICRLNEALPLVELEPADCWTLGPIETELQALQRGQGEELARVPLRSLFARG